MDTGADELMAVLPCSYYNHTGTHDSIDSSTDRNIHFQIVCIFIEKLQESF